MCCVYTVTYVVLVVFMASSEPGPGVLTSAQIIEQLYVYTLSMSEPHFGWGLVLYW